MSRTRNGERRLVRAECSSGTRLLLSGGHRAIVTTRAGHTALVGAAKRMRIVSSTGTSCDVSNTILTVITGRTRKTRRITETGISTFVSSWAQKTGTDVGCSRDGIVSTSRTRHIGSISKAVISNLAGNGIGVSGSAFVADGTNETLFNDARTRSTTNSLT